jgi:hypothetical protein
LLPVLWFELIVFVDPQAPEDTSRQRFACIFELPDHGFIVRDNRADAAPIEMMDLML